MKQLVIDNLEKAILQLELAMITGEVPEETAELRIERYRKKIEELKNLS